VDPGAVNKKARDSWLGPRDILVALQGFEPRTCGL
jgi:hypothetical protein